MKIWSEAIKDTSGNILAGAGTQFVLQGAEHTGLYVEDEENFYSVVKQPSSPYLSSYYVENENNVGSVRKLGSQYNADTNLYVRSNGVECYETSSVSVKVQGEQYSGTTLYYKDGDNYYKFQATLYRAGSSKTYYTRSNGAKRYTTTLVETPLYTDGGTHTYPLFTRVSRNLYAAGSTVTFPAYKKYGGKVYDAGKTAVIAPAEVETQNVNALTV